MIVFQNPPKRQDFPPKDSDISQIINEFYDSGNSSMDTSNSSSSPLYPCLKAQTTPSKLTQPHLLDSKSLSYLGIYETDYF